MPRFTDASLTGIKRCPYCGVASPFLRLIWVSQAPMPRSDGNVPSLWGVYSCSTCGSCLLARGGPCHPGHGVDNLIFEIIPEPKAAHVDLPETARRFLQQAMETLHAPDAAAMIAGSAVDAMLKDRGYKDGSLYARIDQAKEANLLTKGMADWAHSVRLGSNRPRHADENNPHVSPDEALQSVEFAEALGNFLFVLTARIARGIASANEANAAAAST